MLNRDINTIDTQAENTTTSASTESTPAPVPAAAAPAGVPITSLTLQPSAYTALDGVLLSQGITNGVLPADATLGCTITNGNIAFGENMKSEFGDYLVIRPVNLTRYQKVNLGVQNPTEAEKRLAVNCYDGVTVLQGEEQYSKDEYLETLKKQGFSKAKWEDRAVMHGLYIDSDRHDKVSASIQDDDILAVYFSPSSLRAWDSFLVKSSMFGSAGYLKLTKNSRSYNGVNWTQFAFTSVPPVERRAA